LKLQYDEPLSNFAFNLNLRRYTLAALVFSPFLPAVFAAGTDPRILKGGLELGFWAGVGYLTQNLVGRCRSTLSNPR